MFELEFDMPGMEPAPVEDDTLSRLSKLRPVMDVVTELARPHIKSMGDAFPWRADSWGAACLGACAGRLSNQELFVCAVGLRYETSMDGTKVFALMEDASFRLYKIKGGVTDHPMRRPAEELFPVEGTSVTMPEPGTGTRWINFASDWLDFAPYARTSDVPDLALLDKALEACPLHPGNRMAEYLNVRNATTAEIMRAPRGRVPDNHQYRYVVTHFDGQLAMFMRKEFPPPNELIPSKWELVQNAGATIETFLTNPAMRLTVIKGPSAETLRELQIQKVLNNLAKGE